MRDKVRIAWSYDTAPEVVEASLPAPVTVDDVLALIKPGPHDAVSYRKTAKVHEADDDDETCDTVVWKTLSEEQPRSTLSPDHLDPDSIRLHVYSLHPPPPPPDVKRIPSVRLQTAFDVKGSSSNSTSSASAPRYVHDCIHGQVPVARDLFRFIDTPHFQRLRNLRQLGLLHFVFPSATHTRFEHCVGTSHLSRALAEQWLQHQPALRRFGLNEKMVFLLSAAALVHDLGHGPFSHSFDGAVLSSLGERSWTHEEGSAMLLDDLVTRYGLLLSGETSRPVGGEGLGYGAGLGGGGCGGGGYGGGPGSMEGGGSAGRVGCLVDGGRASGWGAEVECGDRPLLSHKDVRLMKRFILGEPDGSADSRADWTARRYLYEVVSNPTTGVDCDKLDYFRRDAYHLGIHTTFDSAALLRSSRVLAVDNSGVGAMNGFAAQMGKGEAAGARGVQGGTSLGRSGAASGSGASGGSGSAGGVGNGAAAPGKAGAGTLPEGSLVTSYHARNAHLVLDLFRTRFALHECIYGHRVAIAVEDMVVDMLIAADAHYHFRDAIRDPRAFMRLTDSIFEQLQWSTDPSLRRATAIADRLLHRRLYKCVGEVTIPWGRDSRNARGEKLSSLPALKKNKIEAADVLRYAPNRSGVPGGRLERAGAVGSGDGGGEEGPSLGTGAGSLTCGRGGGGGGLWSGCVFVSDRKMNYGNKHENPLSRCFFHSSSSATTCVPYEKAEGVGAAHPKDFQERVVRVYSKHPDVDATALRTAFDLFVREELGLHRDVVPKVQQAGVLDSSGGVGAGAGQRGAMVSGSQASAASGGGMEPEAMLAQHREELRRRAAARRGGGGVRRKGTCPRNGEGGGSSEGGWYLFAPNSAQSSEAFFADVTGVVVMEVIRREVVVCESVECIGWVCAS